jgi:hypothetical protein
VALKAEDAHDRVQQLLSADCQKPPLPLAGNLPAQIAAWQRDQQHGLLKQWSNAVEFLPELTPHRLDLLHSVTAESEEPLRRADQPHRNADA